MGCFPDRQTNDGRISDLDKAAKQNENNKQRSSNQITRTSTGRTSEFNQRNIASRESRISKAESKISELEKKKEKLKDSGLTGSELEMKRIEKQLETHQKIISQCQK